MCRLLIDRLWLRGILGQWLTGIRRLSGIYRDNRPRLSWNWRLSRILLLPWLAGIHGLTGDLRLSWLAGIRGLTGDLRLSWLARVNRLTWILRLASLAGINLTGIGSRLTRLITRLARILRLL